MTLTLLPKNIPLKDVVDVMGLDDRPILEALRILLDYSVDDVLPIYFDTTILGEEFDDGESMGSEPTVAFFDHNVPTVRNKTSWLDGAKRLGRANFFISYDDVVSVNLSSFSIKDQDYYVNSPSGGCRDYITLNYNQFYVHREALTRLEPLITGLANSAEPEKMEASTELTWQSLFANPPLVHSEIFTHFISAVESFIQRERKLPHRNQLWEELKSMFEYDAEKRKIIGLSSKPMDRENFRSNFDRYTKKSG